MTAKGDHFTNRHGCAGKGMESRRYVSSLDAFLERTPAPRIKTEMSARKV